MKNTDKNKRTHDTTDAIELAILNGLEQYSREQAEKAKRADGAPHAPKNAGLRSREAMEEAGYKKKRPSHAKGKGTQMKPFAAEEAPQNGARRENKGEKRGVPPQKNETERKQKNKKKPVKVLFFGGVGEIGKNMTAIEYGNDIIVIDAGIIFPTEEMPGIDLVFPDISYLVQNKHKIRGLF